MAAETIKIHHKTPETNKLSKVADIIKNGGVILYPTDSGFALGCDISNKGAIERIRQIRNLPQSKSMTFLCDSLSNISEFAKVSNTAYRLLKALVPGPYTFILPASKLVPKFAQDPKKLTAGIRVPENEISRLLIKELGHPIISISAKADDDEHTQPDEIIQKYVKLVDLVVSLDEYSFTGESTVIDMTTDEFSIIREGAGLEEVNKHIDSN